MPELSAGQLSLDIQPYLDALAKADAQQAQLMQAVVANGNFLKRPASPQESRLFRSLAPHLTLALPYVYATR